MTKEEFLERLADDSLPYEHQPKGTIDGLLIINKYIKDKELVDAAAHDQIWSVSVDALIEAGISEEDTTELIKRGWFEDQGCLSSFV